MSSFFLSQNFNSIFPVVGKMFQITVLLEKRMILDSSPLTYRQISFLYFNPFGAIKEVQISFLYFNPFGAIKEVIHECRPNSGNKNR
jgi:hypothetical protein